MVLTALLSVVLVTSTSMACKTVPGYGLALKTQFSLGSFTLKSEASTCQCCALCYANPDCKSLSYEDSTKDCELYSRVGGYGDVKLKKSSKKLSYFFMEGKSDSNEFCVDDADCLTPGEFCSAHICTTDETVTCKDIYRLAPSLGNSNYWISIGRQRLPSFCWHGKLAGFTCVFLSRRHGWSKYELEYKVKLNKLYQNKYSILR